MSKLQERVSNSNSRLKLLQLAKQKNLTQLKIKYKCKDQNDQQIPSTNLYVNDQYTLVQLQKDIRKRLKLNEKQALFIYLGDHKLAQLRTSIKQLSKNYLVKDQVNNKKYIQFTVQTIQNFG